MRICVRPRVLALTRAIEIGTVTMGEGEGPAETAMNNIYKDTPTPRKIFWKISTNATLCYVANENTKHTVAQSSTK